MTDCCCFNFTFEEYDLDFSIGMCYSIVSGDVYQGTYEITPKIIAQYFYTKDKTMKDNVTVYEIPYHETTNEYGTTVSIAS